MPADTKTLQVDVVVKGRLLLVDDDALFRESLGQNLVDEGYEVENVDGGQAALDYLDKDSTIDTVLLDWRMPGLDGLAVLRLMRERNHTMPVLFLTALTDNIYEEAALALGAVDFISKSRSLSVILQRLSLIMDGRKRPVPVGSGHRIELTLTEFTILQTLAETPKRDFSYRDIYDIVRGRGFVAGWGEEGYRVNVRSFIKRIRQKFRALDDTFDSIKNYSGYGYYWDHGE